MKRDYLYGTNYSIVQKEGMYHFSSDTELLGRSAQIRCSDDVLDIGCASGALLLYAASYQPRSLYGIDLFEDVIRLAEENLAYNHVKAEFSVCRVQDFKGKQFSCILCNPPYFSTENPELVSVNPVLAAARHESFLKPEELFASVKRLLKENGRFVMVHRASRIGELILKASDCGLYCVRLKIAYESEGKNAKSAVLEFRKRKNAGLKIEPPAYMNQRDTFCTKEEAA